MNAASGSEIEVASDSAKIKMPKIVIVEAGKTVSVADAVEGSIQVIGLYGNGANSSALTLSTEAAFNADTNGGTYAVDENTLEVPAAGADAPIQYLVKYEREAADGIKLVNNADKFPNTVKLTLMASYVDPCSDTLKPCYVVIPSFMADPSTTISLDRETQEMDFNGSIQMDFCGTEKVLYYIYFPGSGEVVSGATA